MNAGSKILVASALTAIWFSSGGAEAQVGTLVPLRNISIEIPPGTTIQFLETLESFFNEDGFAVRVDSIPPHDGFYTFQVWRMDLFGIGRNPFSATEFEITFFQNHEPPNLARVNELISQLDVALTILPGVRITEIE